METPDKKELIDGISALLKAHEEPYELGSWENFSKPKKNRRPVIMAWVGIAAALAIIVTAVPFILKDTPQENISASRKSDTEKRSTESTPESIIDNPDLFAGSGLTAKGAATQQRSAFAVTKQSNNQTTESVPLKPAKTYLAYIDDAQVRDTVTAKAAGQAPVKSTLEKEKNIMDFLQQEAKVAAIKKTKETSKWNFGVELLPTLLQNKVNLGAGITTEFKLSDHFSISSGIAYVALDATKTPGASHFNTADFPSQAGIASYASNKRLVSTDAYISGIDIPLALTYNLNKKLYTSIGVSYFNVLSERRSNTFVTELQVTSMLKNSETGLTETLQTRLSEENAELSPETALEGNSYLGFFNLSIGHKQEVFKNYNIVIEPFMKIPVGKLSNEDLKLSNGGVKLRFTF